MSRSPFVCIPLLTICAFIACCLDLRAQGGRGIPEPVIEELESIFDDERFASAFWGVSIHSLDTGKIWYERNSEKHFVPASNQKLLTGAAALDFLGPDFRFETDFRIRGSIANGTLKGDLIVVGDGDPSLYTRFHKDPKDVFRKLAAALKKKGVKRIEGSVIGDDDAYDDTHIGYGWSVADTAWWYGAEVGALAFNENYIDLRIIAPGSPDEPVRVEPKLKSNYFTIDNRLRAVAKGQLRVSIEREFGSNHLTLVGQVPVKTRPFERAPSIANATLFYATVLSEVLGEEGISVGGKPMDGDYVADLEARRKSSRSIMKHRSPPMTDLLALFLKRSQNMYGETLVRAMGRKKSGSGTFAAGSRVVRDRLASLGVKPRRYVYRDGSGMSRHNLVSPHVLCDLLKAMRKHRHWNVWYDALPIAGKDGTLGRRMRRTAAAGVVRAKTGTLSNVRGLSGYVTTKDGEELVFSFLVNAHTRPNRETNEVTDAALALLAEIDRR